MVPVTQVATLVRSKNAGPFVICLDIIFPDRETYDAVRKSRTITRTAIAKLYKLPLERVSDVIEYHAANALKINIVRSSASGSFGETDLYGSQHHSLLDELLVPKD